MKGDPSEYYLVQILDNGGKSEFKRVNNLSLFFSYGLLCHCVFVLRGRNDLIHKKIKVWFWKLLKCKMFSVVFWADTLEYNGYYADLRCWAKGVGGGGVKQQRLLAHASKWGRFLVMISEFFLTEMESLATHAAPPPLKLVHSFFDHARIVLLKEAP